MNNEFHTYIAYRDNNSWTSERGASKFIDNMFVSQSLGYGDLGCVFNGFKVVPNPLGADLSVTIKAAGSADPHKDTGHMLVKYDDYSLMGWIESDYNMKIGGASQSLNRISFIVAYVDREILFLEDEKIVESPSVLKFAEVQGAEATTPKNPTEQQIKATVGVNNPYVILAAVKVASNQTRIVEADIEDLRQQAFLSSDFVLNQEDSYAAGFLQAAPNAGQKTKIVVTGPSGPTPPAEEGVQIIWLKKKI